MFLDGKLPKIRAVGLRLLEDQEKDMICRALEINLLIQKDAASQRAITLRALNYRIKKLEAYGSLLAPKKESEGRLCLPSDFHLGYNWHRLFIWLSGFVLHRYQYISAFPIPTSTFNVRFYIIRATCVSRASLFSVGYPPYTFKPYPPILPNS